MKSIKELFDFRYIIKGSNLPLFAYMLVYLLYAFTTGLEDPLLALSVVIFLLSPLMPSFLMFVFYILWEYESTFSFGLTAVLVMQIIMVGKIIIAGKMWVKSETKIQSQCYLIQLCLLVYIGMMGLASLLLTGNMTGVGLVFKTIITFYVISFLKDDYTFSNLLKGIFHVLIFSTIIATIYGFFHDTALERWVSGMGEVSQLYGTLGTTRMGFFYLLGMTFFLYFVENKVIKYIGVAAFSALSFMTISLTVVALYFIVIVLYFISLGKIRKTITYFVVGAAILVASFPVWSKLELIQPIVYRVVFATTAYEQGDADLALSGREDLSEAYMTKFKNADALTKIFGNADEAVSVVGAEKVAHNTYIDVLFFFGIVGMVLFVIYHFRKLKLIWKKPYFYPLITMKLVLLLGAFTVSIMSATYFFLLIFI